MPEIDEYSLATVPIEQMFNDTSLGHASGFVWKSGAGYFLVTNQHVLTGKDFYTQRNLARHGGRPNKLRALFNPKTRTFDKVQVDISIVDDSDKPLWLINPVRRVDIALVPLQYVGSEPNLGLNAINTLSHQHLVVRISMDVFILGYPFGPEPPGFPVWKRGSIASEPELARMGYDYFLVDTASRPGMSGAPVILRGWGHHPIEGGGISVPTVGVPQTRFIGIYSGRRHTNDPADAQLGLVWPASFLDDIVAARTRDQY